MSRRAILVGAALLAVVSVTWVLIAGLGSAPRRTLVVGGVEDAGKWSDPAGNMARARRAGFGVIVLSSVWVRGATTPDEPELDRLRTAVDAAQSLGIQPIVAVYSFGSETPLTQRQRLDFTHYALAIVHTLPELRYLSLGNEPNSNMFWRPQFGRGGVDAAADAYFRLLQTAYPRVKQAAPHLTIIGGSLAARGNDSPYGHRKTHSPTRFILDLGRELRASGLRRPPLDLFSLHPYPANSSIPPTVPAPRSTAIGIADYPRLVRLLTRAFGTPPPIVYGEYGIQTQIPRRELGLYSGRRAPSIRPVSETRQADDYVAAIRLAACQPLVRMLVFFHVTDESALTGLQTGLFYPDERPKASLRRVSAWARAAVEGKVKCRR